MSYTDMSYTDMLYTDKSYTDMSHTDMSHTNMSYTDMSYTDMSQTNMLYTDTSYTDMSCIHRHCIDRYLHKAPPWCALEPLDQQMDGLSPTSGAPPVSLTMQMEGEPSLFFRPPEPMHYQPWHPPTTPLAPRTPGSNTNVIHAYESLHAQVAQNM